MNKSIKKKTQKPSAEKTIWPSGKTFEDGFAEGYQKGFKAGLDNEIGKQAAFNEGVRHIVTLGEEFLAKELDLPSREALAQSGKLPTWWIATLCAELTSQVNRKIEEVEDVRASI